MPERRDRETDLVGAARSGDLTAWSHLVRAHQEVVFRSAYLVARDTSDAETITRTTFTRGFRSLGSLAPGTRLRPWLIGIAANAARTRKRDLARRHTDRPPEPDPCPRYPASPIALGPAVRWPSAQEREALGDAFGGLTDDDRLLVAARYAFGLSRHEGALSLGIGVGQIEERLRAAMSRLRGRLQEVMAPEARAAAARGPSPSGPIGLVDDDRLGAMTMAAVLSELTWTPDVAHIVCSQLAREAAAYPEELGRGAVERRTGAPGSLRSVERRHGSAPGGLPMRRAAFVVVLALVSLAAISEVADRGRVTDPGVIGALPAAADAVGQPLETALPVPSSPHALQAPETLPVATGTAPRTDGAAGTAPSDALDARVPGISIVGAWTLPSGDVGARVGVDWPPGDGGQLVARQLERKVGAGSWKVVDAKGPGGRLVTRLRRGDPVRLRVRSRDASGTESTSPIVRARLLVRGPLSKLLAKPAGAWTTREGVVIRRRLVSRLPDAWLSTSFTGRSVALVGPAGPTRAPIAVSIDGGPWLLRDVNAWDSVGRRLIFSQELSDGPHSMEVHARGVEAAVDAVLIVRAAAAP